MSTYQTTPLSKPKVGEQIPDDTLNYLSARAKRHAYDLVMKEFRKSGMSKAELSRRLDKGADRISRMLGGPGNWTIETFATLLFAITGGVPKYSIDYPLDRPAKNFGPREHYLGLREQPSAEGKGKIKEDNSLVSVFFSQSQTSEGVRSSVLDQDRNLCGVATVRAERGQRQSNLIENAALRNDSFGSIREKFESSLSGVR